MCIPRCLAYHLDGENDFIALEDVTNIGYRTVSRQNCLSYEECKYIIEALAKFHSISFAFKNDHEEEYNKLINMLIETFYTEEIYETWYKNFHVS